MTGLTLLLVNPSNVNSPMQTKLRSTVKNVAAKRISKAQSKLKGGVEGWEDGNHRDTFFSITTHAKYHAKP